MEKIYRSQDGSLYIEVESQCLNGIFKLQIVHPKYGSIDPYWFNQEKDKRAIVELVGQDDQISFTPKTELFEGEEVEHSFNNSIEYDHAEEDCYGDFDYDVPPGYMEDCPPDVDPENWREFYTGG